MNGGTIEKYFFVFYIYSWLHYTLLSSGSPLGLHRDRQILLRRCHSQIDPKRNHVIAESDQRLFNQKCATINLETALAQNLLEFDLDVKRSACNQSGNKRDKRVGRMWWIPMHFHNVLERIDVNIKALKISIARFSEKRKDLSLSCIGLYCFFDLTGFRHNSLNSEGGACYQVTIFRHMRQVKGENGASKDAAHRAHRVQKYTWASLAFKTRTSATSASASTGTRGFFVSLSLIRLTTSLLLVKMFNATRASCDGRDGRETKVSLVCVKSQTILSVWSKPKTKQVHSVPQPRFSVVNTLVVRQSDT